MLTTAIARRHRRLAKHFYLGQWLTINFYIHKAAMSTGTLGKG